MFSEDYFRGFHTRDEEVHDTQYGISFRSKQHANVLISMTTRYNFA